MQLRNFLRKRRPKVFGLGLSKTGTTTLGLCLRELGYNHTSFDPGLLHEWSLGRNERIWSVIDRHDSFEDWPYPLLFAEIMQKFGDDARYILTMRRDAATWLASLEKHAMRQPPDSARQRRIAYGVDYPQLDEPAMLRRYDEHSQAVRATVERLGLTHRLRVLSWENGDGWNELCSFLEQPTPAKPFPHENRAVDPDSLILAANEKALQQLMAGVARTTTSRTSDPH